MGYFVKNRQLQSGSTGTVVPIGTTAERPSAPMVGFMRYNVTTGAMEYYDGTTYQTLGAASSIHYQVDNFTGTGGLTQFTMTTPVAAANQILVFVGAIYQAPGVGIYSVNGTTTITFSTAPPAGIPVNVIHSMV